jgi:hypothetical protein
MLTTKTLPSGRRRGETVFDGGIAGRGEEPIDSAN